MRHIADSDRGFQIRTSKRKMAKTIRKFAWLYLATLILITIVDVYIAKTTTYGVRVGAGCNLYDAMVIGFECRDFFASGTLTFVLNLPFLMIYGPLMSFMSVKVFVVTLFIWSPPIYLLVSSLLRNKAKFDY